MAGINFDFEFGLTELLPSKQNERESRSVEHFREVFNEQLPEGELAKKGFPSGGDFFVAIIQFFSSKQEYELRDVDNMAKTLMDCLKGKIYKDDTQVRSLLSTKRHYAKVPANFLFLGVKMLKGDTDVGIVQSNIFDQAVTFYNSHKRAE